ncbi:hypothetical protein [Rhizobium binxianense]
MRLKLVTATSLLVLGFMTAAHGVEINQDGANAVKDNLTKWLPDDLRSNGFIAVQPAGTRYEIVYDFAKLLANADPATIAINGLTPWKMFATPLDSGLWNVESNTNDFNISGHFKGADEKQTDFTYSIASLIYNGVFDPAISYLRSGDFTAKDIKFSSKSAADEVSASFDGMSYKLSSIDSAAGAGRINFGASGSLAAFLETVSSQQMPPVEIRADTIDFNASVNGVPAKEIRDIFAFVLDHIDEKQLDKENGDRLKALLKEAFPLFSSFNEAIVLNNPTISSPAGTGGARTFGYNIAAEGPSNAVRLGFGMNAEEVSLDSPMVPASYSAFLPDAVDIQFGIPSMDFAAFGDEFMKIDFTAATNSEESGKKAAEKLFPDGALVIDFPKVSARSEVYDVDISGKIEGRIDTEKDYRLDASILARDLDKTIAAVQELAKTNPDLNQLSFGMMMVKGFAKTDPDGRSRWDLSLARDGTVTVNGQQIKGPDQAQP